jgi:hypothetical protein
LSLDAAARRRYARQLLVGEIGESGQLRLLAGGFRPGADGDAGATAVAVEYLTRAGCSVDDSSAELRVPDAGTVTRFAGSPALRESAATILGAYAAVEHLKAILGVGSARAFSPELTLSDEA